MTSDAKTQDTFIQNQNYYASTALNAIKEFYRPGDICGYGVECDPNMRFTVGCDFTDYHYSVCQQKQIADVLDENLTFACQLHMPFQNKSDAKYCCSTKNCQTDPMDNPDEFIRKCILYQNDQVPCKTMGVDTKTESTIGEACAEPISQYCSADEGKNMKNARCREWCDSTKSAWCDSAFKEYCVKYGASDIRCENVKQLYSCINEKCTKTPNGTYDNDTCNGLCVPATRWYNCVDGECIRTADGVVGKFENDSTCANQCARKTNWALIGGIIGAFVGLIIIVVVVIILKKRRT